METSVDNIKHYQSFLATKLLQIHNDKNLIANKQSYPLERGEISLRSRQEFRIQMLYSKAYLTKSSYK